MKQIHVNIGDQFRLKESDGEIIRIVSIDEKIKGVKQKDPAVEAAYYNGKPNIKTRLSDVKRQISFGSWIKTRV